MRHETLTLRPRRPAPQAVDERALAMARIGVHYACHDFFLEEGQLLARAARLHAVPGIIVQGGLDRVTPPAAAAALHRAWRGSQLLRAATAGHASSHPALAALLMQAIVHFSAPLCSAPLLRASHTTPQRGPTPPPTAPMERP